MTTQEGRTGILEWSAVGADAFRPLVMIHALGVDHEIWAPQLSVLTSTRRVVLLDLPGHGASTAAPGPYTIADLGLDVLDIATAAGAEAFDVCGLSLGGLIALWLSVTAPERVMSLIASNTAARIGSEELWNARIEAVKASGMEGIKGAALARYFTPGFVSLQPETVEGVGRALVTTDDLGYAACCAALRDADLRRSMEAIRCPTLVIGGGQDISTPPEEAVWLHEHIPGSRLRILEGAAHFSNLEQPQEWTDEAAKFLAEQEA